MANNEKNRIERLAESLKLTHGLAWEVLIKSNYFKLVKTADLFYEDCDNSALLRRMHSYNVKGFYEKNKKILSFLSTTPVHPQWLLFRYEEQRFKEIANMANGSVLDIGCAEQKLRKYLPETCSYIGLDYPDTADVLYETKPTVYGDAQNLAFEDNTFDTISFLEVLEHIPDSLAAVRECYRVLKPGGKLAFSMPFLYPIHDAPFDFQRLTIHGLRQLFNANHFRILKEQPMGNPITTAVLLANIALVKTTLNAFNKKHPAFLMILFLPVVMPVLNLIGYIADVFGPKDDFMAHGYTMHLLKEKG